MHTATELIGATTELVGAPAELIGAAAGLVGLGILALVSVRSIGRR